jgi:hypothetical protein
VSAIGGMGASGYQDGYASINLSVNSGGIDITGGSALTATGHDAAVNVSTYSLGGSITLANSSIQAAGKASADGGEGYVSIYSPSGSINAGSGAISATGNTNSSYSNSEVYLTSSSDMTLGSVTATQYVSATSYSGAIVDGNIGLNVSAPEVYMSGYGGVGSIANPIEIQASALSVYSGSGSIGVINTGNLILNGFRASNGSIAIGATGSITVDGAEGYAGGDLSLGANSDINITGYYGYAIADGNLLLNAGGNLNIGGAEGYYNQAYGYASTVAVAGGSINVLQGDYYYPSSSTLGTFSSNTTVNTGGNVVVNNSSIIGGPDVMMQVGGAVFVNGTLSAPGRIEAGSVNTITLVLTGLTGGGFTVNGVSGSVYDALMDTGFFTDGSPAVLGDTMKITYTGASISPPPNTLIVSLNQAIKPNDGQQSTGVTDDKKKEDKIVIRVARFPFMRRKYFT